VVPQAAVREVPPLRILLRRARVVSRLRCLHPRLRPRQSMAHSRCSGSATQQKYVHVRHPCLLCRCLTGVWQEPLVPDMAGSGVDILFKSTASPDGTVHIDYKGEIKRYVCLYVCACVCLWPWRARGCQRLMRGVAAQTQRRGVRGAEGVDQWSAGGVGGGVVRDYSLRRALVAVC